jgi:hypothetical protein
MTWTHDHDTAVARWLDSQAPRHAPADLLDVTRARVQVTRQRRIGRMGLTEPAMSRAMKVAIAAAALIVATTAWIGIGGGLRPQPAVTTPPVTTPPVTAAPVTAAPVAAARPEVVHAWPGTRGGPAGRYAYEMSGLKWMHRVSEGSSVEMTFAVGPGGGSLPSGVPVTIAGYQGTMTEAPTGWNGRGIHTYRYVADMADVRVIITIIQRADTSDADLARARAVITSLRHEPRKSGTGDWLTFLIDGQWDSG